MNTATPVIQVEKLTKFYGNTVGVKDISFKVEQGEIFGFLGPNGAGKTTTIRLLLDLLKPDKGNISVFGKNLYENSKEIRQLCGYLPGEFQAYKHLTGYEYLNLFTDIRKSDAGDTTLLLESFDLKPKDLKRKSSQYSRGMMQKLGIVQALMHNPKLIILDEPTSGLDPLMQEVFYKLIIKKLSRGTTILFSSHNLPEVEKLCHRLAIIRHGEIISVESIDSLKAKVGHMMDVSLSKPFPELKINGAELISTHENHCIFQITGEISKVLQNISVLPITDITISRPSLENVFMKFYKND